MRQVRGQGVQRGPGAPPAACHLYSTWCQAVAGPGQLYHRQCLSCATCATQLTPASLSRGQDGDIHCGKCYSAR